MGTHAHEWLLPRCSSIMKTDKHVASMCRDLHAGAEYDCALNSGSETFGTNTVLGLKLQSELQQHIRCVSAWPVLVNVILEPEGCPNR